MSRKVTKVYVHCSDSRHGDAATIDAWHKERGWQQIGYHYCILNGRRKIGHFVPADDGLVETGRPEEMIGAHVQGDNRDSIGVCLIGSHGLYTMAQIRALVFLLRDLVARYELSWSSIYGHYQAPSAGGKTCPDFLIDNLRSLVRGDG